MTDPIADGSVAYRFGRREYELNRRTYVMGIVNVTPDSFSDGGRFLDPTAALDQALRLIEEGADFVDIGGESTRPRGGAYGEGAQPVSADEESRRVLPVIERLAAQTDVPISVDTSKSAVAARAIAAGAVMVNDISGFRFDPAMPEVIGSAGASAVVMHIKGTPQTMQDNPVYGDLYGEITASLRESVATGRRHGIRQIFVDPGIGFGKTREDNFRLIAGLRRFASLGCPILVGPSRKSFLSVADGGPPSERLEGTLAAVVACILRGAAVVRVHDVRAVRRAAAVADTIRDAADTHET